MGTNKFEKEIQQKFQNREIQPSASAWERLSHKLDTQEQKKKKGWLLYIGYAASIALLISLFFLLGDDETDRSVIPENVIVNKEVTVPKDDKNFKQFKETVKSEEVITSTQIKKAVDKSVKKEEKKPAVITKKKELFKQPALIKTEKTVIAQKSNTDIEKGIDKTIDFKKVIKEETVVANNETSTQDTLKNKIKTQSTNTGISIDSDALLFAVTHSKEEIRGYYTKYKISRADVLKTIEKELKKSKLKIDPNTILAEVERDVNEESFQNNFYQLIKKRVSDVATAIANRNN